MVLTAITARHETLQNIEVIYQADETFTPSEQIIKGFEPNATDESMHIVLLMGSRSWDCRFGYAGGKAYYPGFPRWVEPGTDPSSQCRDSNTLRAHRVFSVAVF